MTVGSLNTLAGENCIAVVYPRTNKTADKGLGCFHYQTWPNCSNASHRVKRDSHSLLMWIFIEKSLFIVTPRLL